MMGPEKFTQVVAVCVTYHLFLLGPYADVLPSEEEVQGAAQHQHGVAVQEDVTRTFFAG